jgi:hypothetical protein
MGSGRKNAHDAHLFSDESPRRTFARGLNYPQSMGGKPLEFLLTREEIPAGWGKSFGYLSRNGVTCEKVPYNYPRNRIPELLSLACRLDMWAHVLIDIFLQARPLKSSTLTRRKWSIR